MHFEMERENGVLCGTTAFGKTVVAIKLIAESKVNTLILLDKVSLVSQWKKRLTEFLRFTSLRVPLNKDEKDVSINELYAEIVVNDMRNNQILEDIIRCYKNGRNCVVLTERTAHVEWFSKNLSKYIPEKFAVMDQKIVWYGSINLMSFGSAEESIMRLESYNIAKELIKSIDKKVIS